MWPRQLACSSPSIPLRVSYLPPLQVSTSPSSTNALLLIFWLPSILSDENDNHG
jgi:hypothetical protein